MNSKSARYLFLLASALTSSVLPRIAHAQIPDRYIGDIFVTAGSFCPQNSLPTDGRTLTIRDRQVLYSLIGTRFGGDGRVNFRLPDLRGRSPVGEGQGSGLGSVRMGEMGGQDSVFLEPENLPPHRHEGAGEISSDHQHPIADHTHEGVLVASSQGVSEPSPSGNSLATYPTGANVYASGSASGPSMKTGSVTVSAHAADTTQHTLGRETSAAGNGSPISVRSPYLALQFCIVTDGLYPPRN